MCWVRHLYRYLQFWWMTPIYWAKLFTDTRDAFLLFTGFLLSFYSYIFFIDSDSNFAKFLHVFLFIDIIIFLVLLRSWAKSKGRILFPKMTRLHGREPQRLGFGWEEPDDPQNPVLPPMFVGQVMRLPQPGFRMPGFQRPPNQPPFVPTNLEHRQIRDQIYRRSRLTDRPNLQRESLFSYTSNLKSTSETTFNPRGLQSSFSEQKNLYQSSRTSRQQRYSLTDTTMANVPQVNIAGGQSIRAEVHAPREYSNQQIRSPYDLINFEASTSRCTREDYGSATRAQAISLEASYLEKDDSDDSSLELPKPISSDKTSGKDGENTSGESSFGKTGSNISLRQSDGSPSESSLERESDSRSDGSYSPEKLLPLSVVELDAAGEMYEIPDLSEKIPRKQSISPLKQSSLEMHERLQFEKAAKDESLSETCFSEINKREQFSTAQTSEFKVRIPLEKNILQSSKKSSNLLSSSEQPFLHKTLQRTGKAKKISSISGKTEEISRSPKKLETTGTGEKTEEIPSTPKKDIEIYRKHKPKHVSSTSEKIKITSCTPVRTKKSVKRKTETSSEDEDVRISKVGKVHKQKGKQKIAKNEEVLESDDSD